MLYHSLTSPSTYLFTTEEEGSLAVPPERDPVSMVIVDAFTAFPPPPSRTAPEVSSAASVVTTFSGALTSASFLSTNCLTAYPEGM